MYYIEIHQYDHKDIPFNNFNISNVSVPNTNKLYSYHWQFKGGLSYEIGGKETLLLRTNSV